MTKPETPAKPRILRIPHHADDPYLVIQRVIMVTNHKRFGGLGDQLVEIGRTADGQIVVRGSARDTHACWNELITVVPTDYERRQLAMALYPEVFAPGVTVCRTCKGGGGRYVVDETRITWYDPVGHRWERCLACDGAGVKRRVRTAPTGQAQTGG